MNTLLLAVLGSLVAGGACASEEVPWGRDLSVMTTTLSYFSKDTNAGRAQRDGYIAVAPQTDQLPSIRYDDYYKTFATLKTAPPRDAFASYLDRNQRTYPIGPIPTPNRSVRIEKHAEPWNDITVEKSRLRNYLVFRAPGYSADGLWAFVTFDFCCHLEGAQGVYVLRNKGGIWMVTSAEYPYGLQPTL